jgi:hypothetical protein
VSPRDQELDSAKERAPTVSMTQTPIKSVDPRYIVGAPKASATRWDVVANRGAGWLGDLDPLDNTRKPLKSLKSLDFIRILDHERVPRACTTSPREEQGYARQR